VGRKKKRTSPIVACTYEDFDKVICETDSTMADYWFVWPDDYEPIRIAYSSRGISSVLHRIHWQHFTIFDPYTNEKERIEAFFFPLSHTPAVRKAKLDVYFYIWVKTFPNRRFEDYHVVSETVPEYYKSAGTKDRHFPPVDYAGWPALE
jgi:hypothetical protein